MSERSLRVNPVRQESMNTPQIPGGTDEPESAVPTSLKLLHVLVRWRRVIGLLTLGTAILAISFSLLSASTYEASVVLYPRGDGGDLLGTGLRAPTSMQGLLRMQPGSDYADLIQAALDSRVLTQAVLERMGDLPKPAPGEALPANLQDMISAQKNAVTVSTLRTGAIRVGTRANSPERAARLANLYAALADSMIRVANHERAHAIRVFLEYRIQETERSLSQAQASLLGFQEGSKTISPESQVQSSYQLLSGLTGELVRLEAELESRRDFMTDQNPMLQAMESQRRALLNQMHQLAHGRDEAGDSTEGRPGSAAGSDIFLSMGSLPSLAVRHSGLLLDVEVQKEVLIFLNSRLEQIKLDESRTVPTLQIIDPASPPVHRSSPRRKLIAAAGLLLGLTSGVSVAFGLEWYTTGLSAADRMRLKGMVDDVLSDLRLRRKRFRGA